MDCISSRTRHQAKSTLLSAHVRIQRWARQEEGSPVDLSIEAHLQQLSGMRALAELNQLCDMVEEKILESFGDDGIGEQLAQTAYNSLCAVGFDCSSFEWALEV